MMLTSMIKKNIKIRTQYQNLGIEIIYTPDYFILEDSSLHHIAIHVEDDKPIPLTETGYRSHFFNYKEGEIASNEYIINIFNEENQGTLQLSLI